MTSEVGYTAFCFSTPPEGTSYLGDAAEDGKSRLYLHPDLSDYLDIPSDAILHEQAISGDPFGAVYIWVQRDAVLTRKGSSG